jgi:hypothetical protein
VELVVERLSLELMEKEGKETEADRGYLYDTGICEDWEITR